MINYKYSETHAQLVAICMFNKSTGKAEYINYERQKNHEQD